MLWEACGSLLLDHRVEMLGPIWIVNKDTVLQVATAIVIKFYIVKYKGVLNVTWKCVFDQNTANSAGDLTFVKFK